MLLSQTEKEWLLGKEKLSEGYERKIKSAIKKKIENFQKFELPLLIKNRLLGYPHVTESFNNVTKNSNGNNSCFRSNYSIMIIFQLNLLKYFKMIIKNVKILMGRTRFERVIPAMSRRYPNQARPPALPSLSLLLFL